MILGDATGAITPIQCLTALLGSDVFFGSLRMGHEEAARDLCRAVYRALFEVEEVNVAVSPGKASGGLSD